MKNLVDQTLQAALALEEFVFLKTIMLFEILYYR